jgi:tetratricopeptide (TPR) repeat protein
VVGLRGARRAAPRVVVAAGVLTACALLVPATRARLLSSATVEGRLRLWSEAVDLVRSHPWLGVGPSGFLDAVVPFHTREWVLEVGMDNPPDSPHSWPLQAAAAGGIGLLLLAAAVAAVTVVVGVRRVGTADAARRADLVAALAAVLGYGAALMTHVTAVGTTVLVTAVAGALVARASPTTTAGELDRPTGRGLAAVAWRTATAGLCVVLAAGASAEWALAAAYRSASGGDVARSADAFGVAQRLRPWDADLTAQAAATFTALASAGVGGASTPAVAWGRAAVERLPDSAQSATALAVALRIDGEPDEAVALLDRWRIRSPYDPAILLQHAATLDVLGDLAGAHDDLLRATQLSPDDPVLLERLASTAERLGRDEEARDAASRARALRAGSAG